MILTNNYNMPEPLVRAVANDPYKYTGYISVTQLIKSPRQRWLSIRHADEMSEDVTDKLWTLMGSAVHGVLERAEDKHAKDIQEGRVEKTFGDIKVSGQADLWVYPNTLQDYKFTSVWATREGAKKEWEEQLNMLAHLYRSIGLEVEVAEIVAIYRDWSKAKSKHTKNYPKVGAERVPVKLWPDDQVEEFMIARIYEHTSTEDVPDNQLPFCTDEERWQKADQWAVMKNKNKRAVKLHNTNDEASVHAALLHEACEGKHNYWIEHRKGESLRCNEYCPAKEFCNQYLQMK